MSHLNERLFYLFQGWYMKTASEQEEAELMQLISQSEGDEELAAAIQKVWDQKVLDGDFFSRESSAKILQQVIQGKRNDLGEEGGRAPVRRMFRYPVAAAAMVIVLLGVAVFLVWRPEKKEQPADLVKHTVSSAAEEIRPGKEGALLTLDDGTVVVLDSLQNGVIATQGGAKIFLKNGRLAYSLVDTDIQTDGKELPVLYNTMRTPRGRQFQMTLPDGTKAWLNAASSIRYPTAFAADKREVEITGEAYFEVVHDQSRPFRVRYAHSASHEGAVEVLGTNFNVNAYDNEAMVKTTLLEGSVRVFTGEVSKIIRPGEQAKVAGPGQIKVERVNIEEAVAWKNGIIQFVGSDIRTIMRQVERWYDVEIVYEGNIPERSFTGDVSRNENISQVLKILTISDINFRIDGRKIIVMP